MRIEGKKNGIRTSNTIKNYPFEKKYCNFDAYLQIDTFDDETGKKGDKIDISLNKNKNWLLLQDKTIPTIKDHYYVSGLANSAKYTDNAPLHYSGGGTYDPYFIGRRVRHTNGNIDDAPNGVIHLPFDKKEYPMYRECRKSIITPCTCCFQEDGRIWQLRGNGTKSKLKTKGMKKVNKRNLDFIMS